LPPPSIETPAGILSVVTKGAYVDLGSIEYNRCWALQRTIAEKRAAGAVPDILLALQHPPVLTLGAGFHESNLLLSKEQYAERGIELIRTDRGGDVTFHGPNQLVLYPIFNIKELGRDVHTWLRDLEQCVIEICKTFGIAAKRFPPHTGVWSGNRKLAAIGVKISRWISVHGIAVNCDNDLSPFDLIVPCGIVGFGVTSLSVESHKQITVQQALPAAVAAFENVFSKTFSRMETDELEARLAA
jgi:lipoate-protein ligase B